MSKLGRLAFVALLLAGSLRVATLALADRALACSCRVTGPEQIGKYKDEPRMVVFVGTVVSLDNRVQDGSGHSIGVLEFQRVFKGDVPSARVPVVGGGGGDCTIRLSVGQRMITVAPLENGVMTPGLCAPYGDPTTQEGQALVQAAIAAYGPGVAPPGATPADAPAPAPADPWLPIILGAVIAAALVLFAIVVVASRRGRTAG